MTNSRFGFRIGISALSIAVLFMTSIVAIGQTRALFVLRTATPEPIVAQTHTPFFVAPSGCAKAHCDIASTDLNPLAPPMQAPVQVFSDSATGGSLGLGCVSNGTLVACSYSPDPGNPDRQECQEDCLVVYDATGYIIYKSASLFTARAHLSVPVMDQNGNLIMADERTIARINPYMHADGEYAYLQQHDHGIPYSPVISNSGLVVFIATKQFEDSAGKHGPRIAAWYADDLTPIGSMQIQGALDQVYETLNSPVVHDNRVYLVMSGVDNDSDGILAAIDIDPLHVSPFSRPWTYAFKGPSGASPTISPTAEGVRIYFDGSNRINALAIGLVDRGTYVTEAWPIRDMGRGRILASQSLDPRGVCLWTFVTPQTKIHCLNPDTGVPDANYSIDLATLPIGNSTQTPTSPVTIANAADSTDPIMLVGTIGVTFTAVRRGYIAAIRLSNRTLLWSKSLGIGETSLSQVPIVLAPGLGPRIVFPTNKHRVYYLGSTP